MIFFLQLRPGSYVVLWPCWTYAPINVKPAGGRQGMGWGFDCLCWSWGRAFDQSCSPGGGDIWIFLRPTSDRRADEFDCRLGRKRLRPNICFPTSTLHARNLRSGKTCHAFYTWASGSDDRGNPIPRIDVSKLIDRLINIKRGSPNLFLESFISFFTFWCLFSQKSMKITTKIL